MLSAATQLKLSPQDVLAYGDDKAKVRLGAILPERRGQLVLVTAMSPSPAGEGKTTVAIGLTDALRRLGHVSVACLREPSMGPVFGIKGGGTGAGKAALVPADAINLHFTGDLHAVTSAHNLLSAVLDNHLHFGNELGLDSRRILWPRVMDMNDRSLRQIVVGLGGRVQGVPREERFDITAASEVMAILALSSTYDELRERLERIVVGFDGDGAPVEAGRLKAAGAMSILLKDALLPNLVHTQEGTAAIVHCGPFANIAHGTSSVLGTTLGLGRADFVIQEAGFGADLGAEKFLDIFSRQLGTNPAVGVLVVTLRALRYHGGASAQECNEPDGSRLEAGLLNAQRHLAMLKRFGLPTVVALNQMDQDPPEQLAMVCRSLEPAFSVRVFQEGGGGALELAEWVASEARKPADIEPLYQRSDSLEDKLEKVVAAYGASSLEIAPRARQQLQEAQKCGYGDGYLCVAKTQYSLSDDPKVVGAPTQFTFRVRSINLLGGAGFIVPLAGEIMTMPGLPRRSNLERMGLEFDGTVRL